MPIRISFFRYKTPVSKAFRSPAFLVSFVAVLFHSCVSDRTIGKNEFLYTGAVIKFHSDTTISGKRSLKGLLKDNAYPLPNRKMVGLPVRLWVYNMMGHPAKTKGLKYYLKYQYGEAPVLLSSVPVDEVTESLQKLLKGNGYLDSRITSEVKKAGLTKKNRKIVYNCYLRPPYYLRNISYDIPDSAILHFILSRAERRVIHPGDQYNLSKLKQERERIDRILKNRGYFYFSPEFITYLADSTLPNRRIDLTMQFRKGINPNFLRPWYVNEILVNVHSAKDTLPSDTITVDSIRFTKEKVFRPKTISRFILFRPEHLMASKEFNSTVKNLSTIGAFKFTNVNFDPDTTGRNKANITIDLIPFKRKNVKAGVNLVSRSNDFAGPGIEASYLNRNFLHGAEQFTFKVNGSIEAWLRRDQRQTIGSYNYEAGSSAELNIPYFLLLNSSLFSPWYIPYTHLTAQYNLVNLIQYYEMSILRTSFGYRWHETQEKYHEFNLIDVSYQHVPKRTQTFQDQLAGNELLARSYEDQFIFGTNYTFQYAIPVRDPRPIKPALTSSIELSGNLLYGLQRLTGSKRPAGQPYRFLGTPYSEYAKFTTDFRLNFTVTKKDKFVTRALVGIGIPMGNSAILPSIEQYFSGGSNSIRAFQLRSIGPGIYFRPKKSVAYFDQTGDIRLEGNLENRFLLAKSLEFALFLDAGNIWLARNDPARPGAQFSMHNFYNQLAVGWGFGFRYLNEYFTIRLDVGYPLRTPNPADDNNQKGLVNFAIGYPF